MIKQITQYELDECISVIKKSFADVAEKFNITKENAPNYVLFSTNKKSLKHSLTMVVLCLLLMMKIKL